VEEVHKAFGLIGPVWRGGGVRGKSGSKDSKGSIEGEAPLGGKPSFSTRTKANEKWRRNE